MSSINNFEHYEMNRGFDLLIRRKGRKPKDPNLEDKKFSFEKVFSFFGRTFDFQIELLVKKK